MLEAKSKQGVKITQKEKGCLRVPDVPLLVLNILNQYAAIVAVSAITFFHSGSFIHPILGFLHYMAKLNFHLKLIFQMLR